MKTLFDMDSNFNFLPSGGTLNYYGKIFSNEESNSYFTELLEHIEWKNDEALIFGKHIITKRKVAWYADYPFEYTYSHITKSALPWIPQLIILKKIIELKTNETFNSCLLNLYHDGSEGMAWHCDGEKDLKKNGAIASLTFGAERMFAFKHKQSKEKISLKLEHGSLLVMKNETQTNWLHRLAPTILVSTPRVNLTFRSIVR